MPQNVNINTGESFAHGSHNAPSSFEAYDHSCGVHIAALEDARAAREVDTAEKFSLWKSQVDADFSLYKSQVDADFGLYKNQRDQFDILNKEISDLKCRVAVNEALAPYKNALIQCEIDKAFTASINHTDRLDCRNIKGQVVLPSTPAVTGYGSYNSCCSGNATV